MSDQVSFDIFLLGLKDPSPSGHDAFVARMHQLTDRPPAELRAQITNRDRPLFAAVARDRALEVIAALESVGARVEIRPATARPRPIDTIIPAEDDEALMPSMDCPRCNHAQPVGREECRSCGLVFAKWERESIQRMQRERRLEQALEKALQVREEWVKRAKKFLENNPLESGAADPFAADLFQDEIPFLRLDSSEGPLLLTSRRLLYRLDNTLGAIPYELIADASISSGLIQIRSGARLLVKLVAPLPQEKGPDDEMSWHLDKRSSFKRDVILDWAFARSFLCGSCGAKELDYRLERVNVHARCMKCATDHEIDLMEAVAIPVD